MFTTSQNISFFGKLNNSEYLPVFRAPSYNEAYPYCANTGQSIHCLEFLINCFVSQLNKIRIVEYFQTATERNFVDSGEMPMISLIADRNLNI